MPKNLKIKTTKNKLFDAAMRGIAGQGTSTSSLGTSVQSSVCESGNEKSGTSVHKTKSVMEKEISIKNLNISGETKVIKETPVKQIPSEVEKLLEDVDVIDPEKISESLENLMLGEEEMEVTEKEEELKEAQDKWERGGNSWEVEEENKSEEFGNGGFSGASAQNKEEFVEVKSKGKKKSEEGQKERIPKGKRYVISQLQEARLIAVSTSPDKENGWPLFIEVPWNALVEMQNEDATDACIGDDIYITKFQLRDRFQTLDESTWFYQGNINWQATATEVELVNLQQYRVRTGFVVETRKRGKGGKTGSIRVIAFGMERTAVLYRRQCVGVDWDNLKKGMFIELALAPIEEGWLIGPNYILPPGCHFRLGTEVLARSNSKIATAAGTYEEEWRWTAASGIPRVFPITQHYTEEEIHLAESLIAAALIVAGEEETSRMETTYVGPVSRVSEDNRRNFTLSFASAEKKFIKKSSRYLEQRFQHNGSVLIQIQGICSRACK
uniref:Uncharacterized protein n=1 Tax=Meloidogyne hapla TaxID=6305 RepID=A0A1I8BQ73_MELHA